MRRRASLKAAACAAAVISMLFVLPVLAAEDAPKPLEVTLERMGDLLTRLDAELAAVDRPAADRLEQRVEEAAGLVEDVLASLGGESDSATPRQGAARLDLTLHRLVALLEEIVGEPGARPERAGARTTLEEVRAWVDGYVAAATSGMNARDAERFDRAAHDLARGLAAQLARVAKKAPATEQGNAKLPQVVARLEALTLQLDELLLRQAAGPKTDAATP
ncbi:MAG: hypothetical protein NTX23_09265 [Candidatus Bipolaricaulota bacterium]|nr:hypothetical protein [Candidatus Bipolaricaulota bacterium]